MQPVEFARMLGLGDILVGQNGVIRRDQAVAAGLNRSRIDDLIRRGRWQRLLPTVYAVGADPHDARVRVRATWLWAGDSAAIGGAAAAWWWGLTPVVPSQITVIVPPPARRAPRPGVDVLRACLDSRDADFLDWVRVTTVPRTCLDLARAGEPDLLETAFQLRRADPVRGCPIAGSWSGSSRAAAGAPGSG